MFLLKIWIKYNKGKSILRIPRNSRDQKNYVQKPFDYKFSVAKYLLDVYRLPQVHLLLKSYSSWQLRLQMRYSYAATKNAEPTVACIETRRLGNIPYKPCISN